MAYLYLFREYWKYSKGHHFKVILALILYIVANLCSVIETWIFAQILNTLQTSSPETVLKDVLFWIYIWIAKYLIFNATGRPAEYISASMAYKVKEIFLARSYDKISSYPLSWHTDHHSGDTINRLTEGVNALDDLIMTQHKFIGQFVLLVGSFISLCFFSPTIGFSMGVIMVIAISGIYFFDRLFLKYVKWLNEANNRIMAQFFDFISNMRTIVILKLGDKTKDDFKDKIQEGSKHYVYVYGVVSQFKWVFLHITAMCARVGLTFWYIYKQIVTDTILVGNVTAVFTYLNKLGQGFPDLVLAYQRIIIDKTKMEMANAILDDCSSVLAQNKKSKKWQNIQISQLSFYYGHKSILDNADFSFKKGDKIAIIGENGAGKSTLMYILRGLYPTTDIQVKIDGKIQKEGAATLSDLTTLMPQDPEVFANTIEYNITMGLKYPKEMVEQVIQLACFDQVLKKMPEGLQTDIREKGVNLSGGERQRLALARNILAAMDSDIILMDEPTSSVDAENEKRIHKGLFKYFKNKTIISTVHKKNLLPMFDRVVRVIDKKIENNIKN